MSIPLDELIEEELKATRLVEESKTKVEQILKDARSKAQKLIDQATKTENIQAVVKEEEEKAKSEAERIVKSYRKRVSKFREIPEASFDKAAEFAVKEVLKFE